MKLLRTLNEMHESAASTESEDFFGVRQFPVVFLPRTAELGKFLDVLEWAKDWDDWEQDCIEGEEGIVFTVRIKSEYVKNLIAETLQAGGAFVSE